ncbi:MAG TPA: rod shape-determining protein MreC [Dehalococcoidia bacterium]|nr:rod shape-determining protein MreC [Dehalococcoidia bacterium]
MQDLALSLASPVQHRLSETVRPLADLVTDYSDRQRLADENARLRADLERLSVELARLRESEARVETLEELLGVRSAFPDETFIAATVTGRSPDALKRVLILNRGASDGVREGMVVLSEGKSLVGSVSKVTANHAWVTLVTDPSSAVSAVVQESRAAGVVVGSHDGERMEMQYVRQGLAVHEGDTVITSGEGGKTPPGLVIGKVTSAHANEQDLFQQITVQPLATLSGLDTVLIMTSFLPQTPGTPESQ